MGAYTYVWLISVLWNIFWKEGNRLESVMYRRSPIGTGPLTPSLEPHSSTLTTFKGLDLFFVLCPRNQCILVGQDSVL